MKAVQLQISNVSVKTLNACTSPCFTGWLTSAMLAAQAAEPSRLIGEQAALDARHHHRAEGAAGKLLKAESVLQDDAEDGRQQPDVHDDDDDRQQHIEHCHHRHEDATDLGNAVDAAKDTEGREDD